MNFVRDDQPSRRAATKRQHTARFLIPRILAESSTLAEAGPRVLEALCVHLEWPVGGLWVMEGGVLRCAHVFAAPPFDAPELLAVCRRTTFASGVGLPGRVWLSGSPVWILDIAREPDFPRAAAAVAVGLRASCGFPILAGEEVIGVMDFFSREIRRPDAELLAMMADLGHLIGQFVARRRAEQAVRANEERYRSVVAGLHEGIVIHGPDGRITACNASAQRILSLSEDQILGRDSLDPRWQTVREDGSLFPGEEHPAMVTLRTGKPCFGVIMGVHRTDGAVSWIRIDSQALFRAGETSPYAVVASFIDITRQREAEEALHRLSGRLLRLQDEERRRLARELHDSVGQSLAAVAIDLDAISGREASLAPESQKALAESRALVEQSLREIRTLAYLLHPPLLDEAGLASALRWYCDGLATRSGIEIAIDIPGELGRLAAGVETAAFRIVQECLNNIHRHSGSPRAAVRVARSAGALELEVRDEGRGLPEEVLRRLDSEPAGLGVGLAGLRERVRQLGGRLEIDSGPDGTSVRALLPLTSALRSD